MLLPASLRPLATGVPIHEEPVGEHFRREPVDRFKTSTQENEENWGIKTTALVDSSHGMHPDGEGQIAMIL